MILDRLDDASSARSSDRREYPRFPFRIKSCPIELQPTTSGSRTSYLAPTRNLSARGMAFLHGMFVHDGTKCTIQLISQYGSWSEITGTVIGCRYVESGVHEVCVNFDDKIEPSDFCRAAVSYRVLIAEDDDSIARLATHHLESLNATVERVENGEEAVEQARRGSFDVILMDIEMPIMDGLEATRALRASGYAGMIYAMTALTRPEDAQSCLDAGCDKYIGKPSGPDVFASILDSLTQEPLTSIYQEDPALRPLIARWVEELPRHVRSMQDALLSEQLSVLEERARTLKGQAGGFGFDSISEAAGALETGIHGADPSAAITQCMAELSELCSLARAPSISGGEAA